MSSPMDLQLACEKAKAFGKLGATAYKNEVWKPVETYERGGAEGLGEKINIERLRC